MDIPEHCDVVVIGGGPAGSMAGTFLSQKSYEVVLFERKKHPRYVVGESFTPHFWKFCDLIHVGDKIQAEGFVVKAGATGAWNGVIRQFAFKDFGFTRPALHVERDRFDYLLLEHARAQGLRVFEEVSALKADLDHSERVRVVYRVTGEQRSGEIACRWIVDASGQNAMIAKQLGSRVIDEGFRFMSVWGYFKDSKYIAADGKAYPFASVQTIPPTTFFSSIGEWGWCWHIPLRERTSVGLVLPRGQMEEIKASDEALETYFLRRCQEIPILNRLLEGGRYCDGSFHVIRDYSYRPTQLTGPGFFLIGDAAAFIDPIFSAGIPLAVYSAYLATWAIDRSFRDPSRSAENQDVFARQFLQRLELSRSLALPRYGVGETASGLAQTAMRFESSLSQELMYVAATCTTRNENFLEMIPGKSGQMMSSHKFRTLEEIVF